MSAREHLSSPELTAGQEAEQAGKQVAQLATRLAAEAVSASAAVPEAAMHQHWGRGVAGVVLAGGLSSRMGVEKAHIHAYGHQAPDMLARTRTLLQALLPTVWVSCRPGKGKEGCDCVYDRHEGLGPFSGVHAALCQAREQGLEAVLCLSCDLPFMDRPTLLRLLHARAAQKDALPPYLKTTYIQVETGFIESLTAIYEVGALPYFEAALAAGERKLSRIIPPEWRIHLPYAHNEALPFFNLNYPADLQVFRLLLAALQRP